jgi:hypothetical protein
VHCSELAPGLTRHVRGPLHRDSISYKVLFKASYSLIFFVFTVLAKLQDICAVEVEKIITSLTTTRNCTVDAIRMGLTLNFV